MSTEKITRCDFCGQRIGASFQGREAALPAHRIASGYGYAKVQFQLNCSDVCLECSNKLILLAAQELQEQKPK